jgi:GT2 family glycosyltransferase
MPVHECLYYTINSIDSLLKQTIPVSVLVINQGSLDGTSEWLDRHVSDKLFAAHFYPPFKSLSGAWNWGLKKLFKETDRVLVVNNDTLFSPETYERLLGYQLETGRHFVTGVSSDRPPHEVPEKGMNERPHPDFSCFLIDRFCWNRVGGFDEHFIPAYKEDWDMHRRLKLAGVEAVCIDVPFQHFRSSTIGEDEKAKKRVAKWAKFREEYYIKKWGSLWPNESYERPFDGKRHECRICRTR